MEGAIQGARQFIFKAACFQGRDGEHGEKRKRIET
jgi:hypothetical protein